MPDPVSFLGHLRSLQNFKFPREVFGGREALEVRNRVLLSLLCVSVIVPVIAGVSGWLIGLGNGLVQADRANLNRTDTVKEARDEAANEMLKRISIGSRVVAIAFIMPEFLALIAGKLVGPGVAPKLLRSVGGQP